MDAIDADEAGYFLGDNQEATARIYQDLGRIRMPSAQGLGGSGNWMKRAIGTDMETSYVARRCTRISRVQDVEQAVLVRQADGARSARGEDSCHGKIAITDVDHGNLVAAGIYSE